MDTVEDVNWQAIATIRERNKFMFNNKLLSDVKFIVQRDGYESNSCEGSNNGKLIIPAHKFVLSISSPVFFAMFYGGMPEAEDSIYLPDCEYESLLELFRFIYSDEVNLTESNVMEVLYLAKKYVVPSLVDKCTEYLQQNLGPSNAFCILLQAQKFEEKDLEESCWKVIDKHTEEALQSSEFVTIDKSSITSIVKRDSLNIKETELFKAVDRWATYEAEKQGLTPDGAVKRNMLGEDIIKAIRFPVMSLKEFASVVPDSNILTTTELADMIKYYGDVSMAPVLFSQTARRRDFKRCWRFADWYSPNSIWYYNGFCDRIRFSVNKAILLHGAHCFGCQGGTYTVTIETKRTTDGLSLANLSGSFLSDKTEGYAYYGFDVLFDCPVHLKPWEEYELEALIQGPVSCYGESGNKVVECAGVTFTFNRSEAKSNGTDVTRGQFPAVIFSA